MQQSEKRDLSRRIWLVSVPIIIQNLISAAVNSADVVMTGFIGQSALSALSLASQYPWIVAMYFLGISSGVVMMGSQYWGRENLAAIDHVQGIAYRYALPVGLLLLFSCSCCPELMMRVYTGDPELIGLGVRYLRMMGPCFLFWSISVIYLAGLKSMERVRVSTVSEIIAMAVNVFLNACFIFGLCGLPKLGLAGIGLATSISRLVQMLICIGVSICSRNLKMKPGMVFRFDRLLAADYRRIALPAVLNEVGWGLGFSMYSSIFGHLGSDVVAANSILTVVRNLACSGCWAMGVASGIIVGRYLGAGRIEDGKYASARMFRMALLSGFAGALLILILSPFVIRAARISDVSRDYLRFMLYVNCVYVIGSAVNATMISGILRSGGDAIWGLKCDLIVMWLYAVPLGALAAFVFKWPVKVVYLLISTDEFIKWPFVFRRYYSYRWANDITRDFRPETTHENPTCLPEGEKEV
ncbi:MAG: MATE family efflux transporter [Spirochaetales bacterium]|nr:MATE family efflux transporter [Spirochaetales bacterium]